LSIKIVDWVGANNESLADSSSAQIIAKLAGALAHAELKRLVGGQLPKNEIFGNWESAKASFRKPDLPGLIEPISRCFTCARNP
jgi:hypothetical protein